MFEKEAEEYAEKTSSLAIKKFNPLEPKLLSIGFQDGAETTLRKIVKYFSSRTLDENCGGYFSRLLESEEELQELAKELENV
jgi:hypothetical protein